MMTGRGHPNRAFMQQFEAEMAESQDVAAVLERRLHVDYVRYSGSGNADRAGWIRTYLELRAAFPDLVTNTLVTLAEDEWYAYRWSAVGHHKGAYFGVPPTGKLVNATGITMTRIRNGLIVEEHSSWNKADVMHTLGIIPISDLGPVDPSL
jgi:predicted ester cyclase